MKALFIITTDDAETVFNAMRLANVGVKKGDEASVFMLGRGVCFEQLENEEFDVPEKPIKKLSPAFFPSKNRLPCGDRCPV